jgi:hypothetical protein
MAAVRKTTPRRRKPRALVALVGASATRRASLFRALRRIVKEQGFSDSLVGAHFEPNVRPDSAGAFAATVAAPLAVCPPGQVRRIVCVRAPDGTVVCEPRCQPL